MKLKIILFTCFLLANAINIFALTSRTDHGTCPKGSAVNQWTATWTYDDKGRPVTGAGIDCDGNPWTKDFRQIYHGNPPLENDTTRAWISNLSGSSVVLEANNLPLVVRVINEQTGAWMTDNINFTITMSSLTIDISTYEPGMYGVVVIYNDFPIQMLDFIK